MNDCPETLELAALVDGEHVGSRERAIRAHVRRCPSCARALHQFARIAEELRARLVPAPGDASPEAFADDVMARLDERRAPPSARRRGLATALLASAAMVAATVGAARHWRGTHEEWTARGSGASGEGTRHVLLRFGRVSDSRFQILAGGGRLESGEVLAADVGHTGRQPLYLLAFLVDAEGERHWIYPAYEVGSVSPGAEPLPVTNEPRVLKTMTRLENLALGPARLFGVVLTAPETVEYIENAKSSELTKDDLAAHYPNSLVVETSIVVGEHG